MLKNNFSQAIALLLLIFLFLIPSMAVDPSSSEAKVHVVYTEIPEGEEPENFNMQTLASVFDSESAANDTLLYTYKKVASAFSTKLTPNQVEKLSQQPGVLQVVPDQALHLHSETRKMQV